MGGSNSLLSHLFCPHKRIRTAVPILSARALYEGLKALY